MVTTGGEMSAELPLRGRTGIPATAHSTGAGVMLTVTCAPTGETSRTAGSATPTFTVSVMVSLAPAMETGSVMARVRRSTALTGPATSTVAGSAATVPTT